MTYHNYDITFSKYSVSGNYADDYAAGVYIAVWLMYPDSISAPSESNDRLVIKKDGVLLANEDIITPPGIIYNPEETFSSDTEPQEWLDKVSKIIPEDTQLGFVTCYLKYGDGSVLVTLRKYDFLYGIMSFLDYHQIPHEEVIADLRLSATGIQLRLPSDEDHELKLYLIEYKGDNPFILEANMNGDTLHGFFVCMSMYTGSTSKVKVLQGKKDISKDIINKYKDTKTSTISTEEDDLSSEILDDILGLYEDSKVEYIVLAKVDDGYVSCGCNHLSFVQGMASFVECYLDVSITSYDKYFKMIDKDARSIMFIE